MSSSKSALIGHTGLVGNNLVRQYRFDDLFNSSNIGDIAGNHYDLLVCSGTSGTKWLANKDPEKDRASIARLFAQLKQVTATRLILISTVDVYGNPYQVDENTPINPNDQTSYGRHRHEFEQSISAQFENVLTARLPAIYGWQLKKNALFDLMHHHEIEKINPAATYQFYWLEHLWRDLQRCLELNLNIVNFATEPLSINTVAHEIFGIELKSHSQSPPPNYDFKTIHDKELNGNNGYLYDKLTALEEIRTFVAQQTLCKG